MLNTNPLPNQAPDTAISILLIDDSPEDRFFFRRILMRGDAQAYALTEAGNTEKGLEVARDAAFRLHRSRFCPAGPQRAGRTTRTARRVGPAVVMMTGTGSEEIAVEAMKRGAHDYLVKTTTTSASLRIAIQTRWKSTRCSAASPSSKSASKRIAETFSVLCLPSRRGYLSWPEFRVVLPTRFRRGEYRWRFLRCLRARR